MLVIEPRLAVSIMAFPNTWHVRKTLLRSTSTMRPHFLLRDLEERPRGVDSRGEEQDIDAAKIVERSPKGSRGVLGCDRGSERRERHPARKKYLLAEKESHSRPGLT